MTRDRTELLANILSAEAERQGLSGVEIARRSGLNQTGVAKILRGDTRPLLDSVVAVLGALGRDLAWLHRSGVRPGGQNGRKVDCPTGDRA